jgi:hypothetical protein
LASSNKKLFSIHRGGCATKDHWEEWVVVPQESRGWNEMETDGQKRHHLCSRELPMSDLQKGRLYIYVCVCMYVYAKNMPKKWIGMFKLYIFMENHVMFHT